jgi:hypothetical protein
MMHPAFLPRHRHHSHEERTLSGNFFPATKNERLTVLIPYHANANCDAICGAEKRKENVKNHIQRIEI